MDKETNELTIENPKDIRFFIHLFFPPFFDIISNYEVFFR
jgi:hypothetical protein